MAEIKFEAALKKLEDIVRDLESGDLLLDESLAKYEEGIGLAKICQKKLETAQKKVEILVKSKDGKVKLEPFGEEAPQKKKAKKKHHEDEGDLF